MAVAPSGRLAAPPGPSHRGRLRASGGGCEPRYGGTGWRLPQRRTDGQAGDAEAARGGLLEGDAAERPLRGGAHGGPERAGLEAAEPPPRRPALLHADAARPGLPQGRQLPPREPLRRGLSRGPPAHRAGHYGAFLQEEWDLLQRMILLANEKLSVPITCKIRVFPEIDKTVKYAQMLEKAGCQLLTVHGRTKEQKGPLAGVASWEHIQAVRKAVSIPVFANGNIQCLSDVEECIRKTGVHGVMSAEGNLHNPALFEGRNPLVWEMAEEYLEIVQKYPCPLSYVRAHLFKLWHHTLQVYQQLREELAKVKTLEGIVDVNRELKLRCQEEIANQKEGEKPKEGLPFFHWICQPYIRPGPKERCKENGASGTEKGVRGKRALEEEEDGNAELLSKNKQKKKLRNPNKSFDPSLKPKYAKCDQCGNPKGNKCVFNMCRGCCKKRAFKETADCPGHGLLFKTKYEKSLSWQSSQRVIQTPEISRRGAVDVGETAALEEAGDSAV
ncbi:tRNA-dihydrouridine(16/17) synthase [NAD(P)(+)]-like isoform X1 [Rissa tridactyla]|uniref:tRNA-dihydrouridine(16/17) synthase [NAD(P)(+)]-like isoform X1 n=1 Tax=Rissa tridactyla TaxID=75485 RepID=UPI0023BA5D37|nr:tRNA-dihydrouridine(16/17) synthase [NAD(P)(+)]-like isoform X1 [Rissa tridactyla]